MKSIACIVEGHSEVASLPILLDRLAAWLSPEEHVGIIHGASRSFRKLCADWAHLTGTTP